MALPDFLLVGAPKAGTTALHVALARHPDLFLSRNKEPKFFLSDGPPPTAGGPGDAATYRAYVWRRRSTKRSSTKRLPVPCAASPPRCTCGIPLPIAALRRRSRRPS